MLPLLMELLGSMANTATLHPFSIRSFPNTSMKVLFPAPGTPVIPILIDRLAWGMQASMISLDDCWCFPA
jgi:hypothetical protein